jgi:uncharacterized membrane protein YqjE
MSERERFVPKGVPERGAEREEAAPPVQREEAARQVRREEAVRPAPREESLRDVARELISDIGDLLRAELRLARREIRSDVNTLLMGAVWMAIGGVAVFLGITYLLLAAIFALANTMSLGLAAFIVGVVVLIVGAILAWVGWGKLKSINPLPEQTVDTLREDAEWLRNRTR